jgi:toxin ParE1/3/4
VSRGILIRPAAERDLDAQAEYIAISSGGAAALRFYRSAAQTFQLLARSPSVGRRIPYRHPLLANARMLVMKGFPKHLIFYRLAEDQIEVIRVIHGARDIENLFEA